MKNFAKLVMGALVSIAPFAAFAETLTLSQTVAAQCTFSSTVTGGLNVNGSSFSTVSNASTIITNNSAGTFEVLVAPGGLGAPNPITLVGDMNLTPSVTSGPNNGIAFAGDNASGYSSTLAAAGDDTFELAVSGTLSATAVPGFYAASSEVTCATI